MTPLHREPAATLAVAALTSSENIRIVHCDQSPSPQIKDHVLLGVAGDLEAADARLRPRLTDDVLRGIVDDLPDAWLGGEPLFPTLVEHRRAYMTYLSERLHGPRRWLQEAIDARRRGPERLALRQTHRLDADE